MKKALKILLSLMLAASCLYACGSDESESSVQESSDTIVSGGESSATESSSVESSAQESDVSNNQSQNDEVSNNVTTLKKRDLYVTAASDSYLKGNNIAKQYAIPGSDIAETKQEHREDIYNTWADTIIPESITIEWWGEQLELFHVEGNRIVNFLHDGITSAYKTEDGKFGFLFDPESQLPVYIDFRQENNFEGLTAGDYITAEGELQYIIDFLKVIYPDIDITEYEVSNNSTCYNFCKYTENVCTELINVQFAQRKVMGMLRYIGRNGQDAIPNLSEEEYLAKATELLEELYLGYEGDVVIKDVEIDNANSLEAYPIKFYNLYSYDIDEYLIHYTVKYTVSKDGGEPTTETANFAMPYADKNGNALS